MTIAVLGGTGKEGTGLAARWARAGHAIVLGSRDAERARAAAAALRARTGAEAVTGDTNAAAAAAGDVLVVALPYEGLAGTLPALRDASRAKVVVSAVVPLTFGGPRLYTPPPAGSAAEEVQALLPEARVVAAFHHIAAHALTTLDAPIDCDLLLCGGDAEAKQTVVELGRALGLRAIDVGPLTNAGPLEAITAVLAAINRRYRRTSAGIRITGL